VKHTISYGPEDFIRDTDVSRETLARLQNYAETLTTWNKKVNLVGRSTLDSLWYRHFLDSAQLYPLFPRNSQVLLDLGSGAGFPGLVLAIMGCPEVHLVESDRRKAAFLREAARLTGARVQIHNVRIEALDPFPVDIVTARALAPLSDLLAWSEPFLTPKSHCIFLKGRNVGDELTDIHNMWETELIRRPSRTDQQSTILCISEVRRVRSNQT
jgi:16S rRNA (guanine527-N7)-methyltransferase